MNEAALQKLIVDYMTLDGWRALRTDPVSDRRRGKGFGEPGMPDMLFLRYRPRCQILWVEVKTPRGRIAPHQLAWALRERLLGADVVVMGKDCEPSFDGFQRWYQRSGFSMRV